MKLKYLIFIITIISFVRGYSQNENFKFVNAKSGLLYRETPKGKVIGKLNFGEKVKVIEKTSIYQEISDNNKTIKGEWLGFRINNKVVYSFGGYLIDNLPKPKEELITILLRKLNIDKSQCKSFHTEEREFRGEQIVVIAEKSDKTKNLNAHIVICDIYGNIKSKFSQNEFWSDNAIFLTDIVFLEETEDFYVQVKDNVKQIPIGIQYANNSSMHPYRSFDVYIFIEEKNKIKNVLKDCSIYYKNSEGEYNTDVFVDSKTKSHEGFYNLELSSHDGKIILEYINGEYKQKK